MGKLFGTDGIRGKANQYPITPEMALSIGRALAVYFGQRNKKIIIGKDTRISGDMIETALAAGICSMGIGVERVDILPTPGIAFLTLETRALAGIVISASHNPYSDNGIKVFGSDGLKLTDAQEQEIEALIFDSDTPIKANAILKTGRIVNHSHDAEARYRAFLKQHLPNDFSLKGLKIDLDCSNGATYRVAPLLFAEMGAEVEALSVAPDGININEACGSENLDPLISRVKTTGADIGLAFDGDGDRVIAIDEKGDAVTGDHFLAICGKHLKKNGRLKNNRIVSTVMSNFGLSLALKQMGIEHLIADVGDRYVLEMMRSADAALGGEDSGHLIFLDNHTTGDGLLAALKLIEVMVVSGKPLSHLRKVLTIYPQVLVNVSVSQKPDLKTIPSIAEMIRSVEESLDGRGRVLVRYSGTQPLCRVMVEGPDRGDTERYSRMIADAIQAAIGK